MHFPRKLLGIPEDYLWDGVRRMLTSVFENRFTAVQSGHSLSKDYTAGIAVLQWLFSYPFNSKVICTAPKLDQVKLIMFAEIAKQYRNYQMNSPWPMAGEPPSALKFTLGPEWYAVGMTTKSSGSETDKKGKFQGFKSPNLLIIVTEAQAVEDNIFDEMVGNITSSNAHILEIGNPISPSGRFWEHCTQPRFKYNVIKLSCFDSPNVKAGRDIVPGMVTSQWIEDRRSEWGEDHPYWFSRVLGEFPQSGKDSIIPIEWIMSAVREKEFLQEPIDNDCMKVAGLDVSKGGAAETVHQVLTGPKLTRTDAFHKVDIVETVGWAKNLSKEEQLLVTAVDEGGLAGVAGFLEEDKIPTVRIMFGAKLEDHPDFDNLGAIMYWNLRLAFQRTFRKESGGIFIPNDPMLIGQLAGRKYTYTSRGVKRITLEKKELNSRTSGTTFDRSDALAQAWHARLQLLSHGNAPQPKFVTESSVAQSEVDALDARSGRDRSMPRRRPGELESTGVRY